MKRILSTYLPRILAGLLFTGEIYAALSASVTLTGSNQKDGYYNAGTSTFEFSITITGADQTTYDNGNIIPYVDFNASGTFNQVSGVNYQSLGNSPSSGSYSLSSNTVSSQSGWPGEGGLVDFQIKIVDQNFQNPQYIDVTLPGGVANLTIDRTSPYFSNLDPTYNDYTNDHLLTFWASEGMASGTINWSGDDGSSQNYVLSGSELDAGWHTDLDFSGSVTLTNGVVYTLQMTGEDNAGNPTTNSSTRTGITFDNELPTVTTATSSASNIVHKIGDLIPFTLTFSEAVITSSGSLVVTFNSGGDTTVTISSYATSASGTYRVAEGDTTNDLTISSLAMTSGGSLIDQATNAMTDFSIPSNIAGTSAIGIDGNRPTISNLTSTSTDQSYGVGDEINITVNFSENVSLDGGSTVSIELETGTTDHSVTISTISSTASASAIYTVNDGDFTNDLAAKVVTIAGTLRDAAGNQLVDNSIPTGNNISDFKDIVIETTPPTILSVTSTSTAGQYGIDDNVNITVNFSEAVTLAGGNLLIPLETGTSDYTVTIATINNATSASGTYTVRSGDESTNLAVNTTTGISLSGGELVDVAGNAMSDFTLPGGQNISNVQLIIDGTRPSIATVTSTTSDGTYKIGDQVNVTLTFSESMTLSSGSLELLMETGTTDQTVLISAFTGQLSASGTYTVQEGDESSDLTVSSVALGTGAVLEDAAGNAPANLQIPATDNLADNSAIVIDGVRPTIVSITSSTSDGDYMIGDDISFTITFSEAVTLSAGNLQVTFETGTTDQTVSISSVNGTTVSGTYTVQAGDESSDLTVSAVTVAGGSILDANLNAMTDFSIPTGQNIADGSSIVVDGVVPVADQVGSITTVGGNVTSGYWNGTNTSVEVIVPLDNTDNSLVGGTIQLIAKVDANSYANLGSAATINSTDVSTGLKSISIAAATLEALTGFADDGQISIKADVSDKAGNTTAYTVSNTTLTIDQTAPTYSSITSSDISGTYKIGDNINITVNFSEAVSLDQGDFQILLNTGQTVTIAQADLSNALSAAGTYTVQSGDETTALEVSSLDVSTGGQLIDAAGNPMLLSVLVVANDLTTTKTMAIDGIAPTQYALGTVTATGGTVIAGYWNNSNSGISVTVPLNADDASLDDGVVQLKGKLTTSSSYTDIGSPVSITNADRTAGTMTVSANDTDLGALLTDAGIIEFIATVTDAPGNSTSYTTSATTLTVDLTGPTNQIVGDVTATGGTVVANYWNGTNEGVSVVVPIDGSDNSLVGGSLYLQAISGTGSNFDTVGVSFSIANADLIAGSKTLTASATGTAATDLKEIATWSEGNALRFRAVIYDVAGNSQVFTESGTTLLIDETIPNIINVFSTSGDGAFMEDDTIDIFIKTSESVIVGTAGTPQLTLETGTTDAVVDYDSGSGTDSLKFRYVVAFGQSSSDLDYASSTALSLGGSTIRDAAGNDMILTLPDPGGNGSLSSNNNIVVDTQIPSAAIALDPDSLYRAGETVNIIVSFDESIASSPTVQVDFAGGTVEGPYSMVQAGNDSTWSRSIVIPAGNDGLATITVTANDLAGNALINGNTTGRQLLRVDNTAPTLSQLTPADSAYVNHTRVSYLLSETVASGTVTWVRTAGTGDPDSHVATLDATQLIGGFSYQDIALTPVPPLVDGTVYTLTFSVADSAGNTSLDYSITSVTYDTTRPTVTFTYTDTVVNGGTDVTITATFDESIRGVPLLAVDYAGTDDITDLPLAVVTGTDSTQFLQAVTIPTGEGNNGYAALTVVAQDRAGNTILTTGQTNAGIMLVDNSPPSVSFSYTNLSQPTLTNMGKSGDIIRITATFNDRMKTPTLNVQYVDTLITGVLHNGTNPSDSVWIYDVTLVAYSSYTGTITFTTDSTDYAGNSVATYSDNDIFELDDVPPAPFVTGEILPIATNAVPTWINESTTALQINVPVVSATSDPTMINGGIVVEMYNLTRGTDYQVIADTTAITQGGVNIVTRGVTDIVAALSLQNGDRIRTRAVLYDRVGNQTVGDTSSVIFHYDVSPPVYSAGSTTVTDTLYSSDQITTNWTGRFAEANPDVESGLEHYEYALENIADGDTTGFVNWYSTGEQTQLDTLLPFRHQSTYRMYLRSYDVAGNVSDIVSFDTLYTRLNTSPIISPIDSVGHFEDLPYTDTVTVTDADLTTLLGDEFRYYATTTRLVGQPAVSSIVIDSLTGIMNWTPTQADTGEYRIDIRVNDNWGFADTVQFAFTVTAVNDTPTVVILPPDDNIVFNEDHTDTIRINLTQYAHDVDNDSTVLTWQAVILDTSAKPGFPLGRVIVGPGTPYTLKSYLSGQFAARNKGLDKKAHIVSNFVNKQSDSFINKISISIDTLGGITYATFDADSNYYGSDHRIIFFATDPSGAFSQDTILLTILPENDPPTWLTVENQFIYENDSLKLDITEFVTDVDDTLLSFSVSALTNSDKLTITPSQFTATTTGDSIVFLPQTLWSDSARIQLIVNDGQAADTVQFTLDIIRVKRPHLSIAVIQNNAFTNYFNIIVTDSAQKTRTLSLTVQQQTIPLDTIAHFTYSGTHSFDQGGTYQFDAYAIGVVGDTTISRQVGLTIARSTGRWSGGSPDGNFRLMGESGAVGFDQAILVVDSSMFVPTFNDRASYLMGNEDMVFEKPILVSFRSARENLAIYRRDIGYDWVELPSVTEDETIIAYTDRMGYYRLGPKTIYVPGKTSLVNNYPNPFNPYTTIEYDIGFRDGPNQDINISIFNIRGQHIATLYHGKQSIGRHTVSWNSRDDNGSSMATGLYFVRLTTSAGLSKTKKVMLIR